MSHAHTHTHARIQTHALTQAPIPTHNILAHEYTGIHTYINERIQTHTHINTHLYTTYTHTISECGTKWTSPPSPTPAISQMIMPSNSNSKHPNSIPVPDVSYFLSVSLQAVPNPAQSYHYLSRNGIQIRGNYPKHGWAGSEQVIRQ